jgi:hypothetical protein
MITDEWTGGVDCLTWERVVWVIKNPWSFQETYVSPSFIITLSRCTDSSGPVGKVMQCVGWTLTWNSSASSYTHNKSHGNFWFVHFLKPWFRQGLRIVGLGFRLLTNRAVSSWRPFSKPWRACPNTKLSKTFVLFWDPLKQRDKPPKQNPSKGPLLRIIRISELHDAVGGSDRNKAGDALVSK